MIMITATVSQDVSKHPGCGSFHMMVACLRLLETAACGFLAFQKNCHFNIYEPPPFHKQIMLRTFPHLYATFKVPYNLEYKLKISFSTDVCSQ